jgi:hypothetical protein
MLILKDRRDEWKLRILRWILTLQDFPDASSNQRARHP